MASDLEIARASKIQPLAEIAATYGIEEEEFEPYGRFKGKVDPKILKRLKDKPQGKYIDVTAITPTPLGEGKTTNTVGLTQGLHALGKKVACCIRQASMGPVFGIKGGAAGGGYAQVIPSEELNLHLNGDIHAVAAANNLACAFLDNHLKFGNDLQIDPHTINIRRVVDINDRNLRSIVTGLGGSPNGIPRESGFDIAVASEVMAILSLAQDIHDLRKRIGNIVAAFNSDGKPVTCEDIKVAGAMTAILKEAIKPNLLQCIGGALALIHCGPFANIAQGNSSIIADQIALKLADYVVTESGFGADMGAEKFFNIKCRQSGLVPDAAALVATVRALKSQSGRFNIKAGKPLPEELLQEDLESLEIGLPNLIRHIKNVRSFGVPVVVAINAFPSDSPAEYELIRKASLEAGASECVISEAFAKGGEGARDFAQAMIKACEEPKDFKLLYQDEESVETKAEAIAQKIYGASKVVFSAQAKKRLKQFEKAGYKDLALCMAKTQYSFSHNPKLLGAPKDFELPITDARLFAGAGFITLLCGDMNTMPGLPKSPGGEGIDIDSDGQIIGLF